MQTLFADDAVKALTAKWIEAKQNMNGWAAVKKEAEAELASHYKAEFEQIVDGLNDTTNLTATVQIGDDLKVTVGSELQIGQPEAVEFLRAHPSMLGVLLRVKYDAVSSAVVISKLHTQDEIGMALAKVVALKEKTPGFSSK